MKALLYPKALVASVLFAALVPGQSHAAPITIDIEATVRFLDDRSGILGGALAVGSVLTGSYTYDSDTPDGNSLATVGDYWHYAAPYGISLSSGGLAFATDPADVLFLVEVVNDHYTGSDNYLLRSYNNLGLANGAAVEHISWQLDDPSMTALASDSLPLGAPVLADWPADQFYALTINGGLVDPGFPMPGYFGESYFIRADVTSATLRGGIPESVPEPAAPALMALGLGALAFACRRGKRALAA